MTESRKSEPRWTGIPPQPPRGGRGGESPSTEAPSTKAPILVVDDEKQNLNLLVNVLGDEYTVIKALDADQAIAILRKRDVHLILTDQRMPGRSGVELLDQARTIRPDAVRILITAYPDVNVAVDAINRGQVKRYIAKPFDPAELKIIVRQELEVRGIQQANLRLAEELARKVEELQKLDKMKDHFLANVSHELKTPLVSALGYVDLLLGGGLGTVDDRQRKGLQIAYRNLERLLALIEDLLALAKVKYRPDLMERKRFDLREMVHEAVESLKGRSRKKSLEVRVTIPKQLPPIEADERKVHSVLTNILSNAEKFTSASAEISIRVRKISDDRCEVQVEDNGIGVKKSQSADFPYFRTADDEVSKKYGGLGVGLSLAREILQAHGCSIRLEPAAKVGARVTFDLPLARS